MFEIIIDDREKAVIPLFEAYNNPANMSYKVMRVTIGDYNIMYKGSVICTIERKTWKDLAASIKDGRKANVSKMIDLRKDTRCMVFYLMEGVAFSKPKTRYGRIPYKNLRAHLDHLMFRDNIHVIHSKNQMGTVKRLFEICQNLSTVKPVLPCMQAIDDQVSEENKKENQVSENQVSENQVSENQVSENLENKKCKNKIGGEARLKKNMMPSDTVIKYAIWTCVPNITERTAGMLMKKYHISDLILGKIPKTEIFALKYPSGHIVGKRADKIWKASRPVAANKHIFIKMLSQIRGITKKTATAIYSVISWENLLKGEITHHALSEIKKPGAKRSVGKKNAARIRKFFTNSQI